MGPTKHIFLKSKVVSEGWAEGRLVGDNIGGTSSQTVRPYRSCK